MKKICIVPFTVETYPLLNHLRERYIIEALVSPKGIGLNDEDISLLRNTSPTGYYFINSMEEGIRKSEVILIPRVDKEQKRLYEYAKQSLQFAASNGKQILCFLNITDSEKEDIIFMCRTNGADCYFPSKPDVNPVDANDNISLFSIDVPVLYIGELIPSCDSYDIFLNLAVKLQKRGKNVLAISEDCYNPLFGFHCERFGGSLEVKQQIFRINRLIDMLVKQHHPDLILIRLPQPLMRYNNTNVFDCGGMAFLISQAVPGTGCILCSPAKTFTASIWEEISDGILSKFGYPVLGVHVSNQIIDSTSGSGLSTLRIPLNQILPEITKLNESHNLPFYQLMDQESLDEFSETLELEYFNLPFGVI